MKTENRKRVEEEKAPALQVMVYDQARDKRENPGGWKTAPRIGTEMA